MTKKTTKTAIITGAASGLGLAMLELLIKENWKVAAIDCDEDALNALKPVEGVQTYHADILNYESLVETIQQIFHENKSVELFINNAGRAAFGSITESPQIDWEWVYSVNVFGTMNSTKIIAQHFKVQGHGHIHFVSSAAGFSSLPNMGIYNSSKAAIISIAETLKSELSGTRIKVSVSMPSFFKTNLLSKMRSTSEGKDLVVLLMNNSNYSVEQAAMDITTGIKKNKFYIFAPSRVKSLWRWKNVFPNHYLSRMPRIISNKLKKLKS